MNTVTKLLQALYAGLIVGLAGWQLHQLFFFIDMDRVRELLAIVLLGILAEWLAVPFPFGQLSGGFALILATYALFGPAAAVWVAGVSTLFGQGIANRGNPILTTFFNAGQYVLAAIAAGWLCQWYTAVGAGELSDYLPLLVFSVCFLLANHLLVFFYLLPKRRQYPGQSWLDAMKWDSLTYLVTVPLGLLIVMVYPYTGLIGLFTLFFSVFILQLIMRHYVRLNVANKELKVFYEVANYLENNPSPEDLLEYIMIRARNVFSFHAGVAYLQSGQRNVFTPVASSGYYARKVNQAQIFHGQGVVGEAIEARTPEIIDDCRQDPRTKNEDGWCRFMRSLLIVPLLSGEEELGVVVLGERRPLAFDEKHIRIMSVLCRQTVLTLEKSVIASRMAHAATLDNLTGMLNAAEFFQLFRDMVTEGSDPLPMGIIMFDVDRMQRVNDHYGREAGDMLLRELSSIIGRFATEGDLAARFGGEEFILVLDRVTGRELMNLAYSIRNRVMDHSFLNSLDRNARITISAGIAEFPQDASDAAILLNLVQKTLKKAQKKGNNQVLSASTER